MSPDHNHEPPVLIFGNYFCYCRNWILTRLLQSANRVEKARSYRSMSIWWRNIRQLPLLAVGV
jgi:hypothetical protein